MKRTRKFLAMLLSLVMALVLAVPAMATGGGGTPTNYTITLPDNMHTYEIYQIFTGDLSGGVLTNVKWGQNGTGTAGDDVDASVMNALTAVNSKSDAEKLTEIEKHVSLSNPYKTIKATDDRTVEVSAGYYLIKDKDGSVSGMDSYTKYIVQVVGNVTIELKSDVPEFEKKVKDINDSTDPTESGWQDSADHDIGDKVKFQLKGTVAENFSSYKGKYYFAFHDQQSKGLTFDSSSVEVFVDGTKITSDYEVITSTSDNCTFEVIFADLKKIDAVHDKSVITVEYTATLNNDAVIGSAGNPNQAKLEFSNNPNAVQSGDTNPETGETPWDKVIVFTYKTIINKTKQDGTALSGAAFKLEKKQLDGSWKTVKEITAGTTTTFEFVGLDDGVYKLTETTHPDGYNPIDPIEFTVTAEHVTLSDNPSLTSLSGNAAKGEIEFTPDVTNGSLSSDVVNQSGASLPTTGGVGTTLFYVIGSILVVGAGVLLVTKKRMNSGK